MKIKFETIGFENEEIIEKTIKEGEA